MHSEATAVHETFAMATAETRHTGTETLWLAATGIGVGGMQDVSVLAVCTMFAFLNS